MVHCEEVLANDSFTFNIGSIVETAPTFAPVYGRMHQSFRSFFVPRRLYTQVSSDQYSLPALFNPEGATEQSTSIIKFLPFTLSYRSSFEQDEVNNAATALASFGVGVSYLDRGYRMYPLFVSRGSLFEDIGMPVGDSSLFSFGNDLATDTIPTSSLPSSVTEPLNALPLLGYLDCVYNYYANHHASFVPIRGRYSIVVTQSEGSTSLTKAVDYWFHLDLKKLSYFLTDCKTGRASFLTGDMVLLDSNYTVVRRLTDCFVDNSLPVTSGVIHIDFQCRHALSCLCTPMPDINTSWISDQEYSEWLSKAIVPVNSNQVQYEDIITASSLYRRAAKLALGDGTFDDFYAAVNGVRADETSVVPQYLGGFTRNLDFQQIRQSASTSEGTLGGYAGYMSQASGGHLINFSSREPGYLIVLMTIYPELTYGGGIAPYLQKTQVEDFYSPDFANIGYQARRLINVQAFSSLGEADSGLDRIPSYNYNSGAYAVGYQPAWTEYTTAVNRSTGDLGPGAEKDFWTFHAPYDQIDGVSFMYIYPEEFNYIFATSSENVDNYMVQVGFDIKARRSIPKRLMPALIL